MSDHSPQTLDDRDGSNRNFNRDRDDRPSYRGGRTMSLLVRNLKYETTPEILREAFEKFGPIRDVYIPLEYYTKKPRGFGFVEFHDFRDANMALREMDGGELDGNKIEVFAAKRGRSDPYQMKYRERRVRNTYRRSRSSSRGRRSRYRSRSRSGDRRNGYSRRYDRRPNRYSRSRSPQRISYDNRRSHSVASRRSRS
ncbi:Serine/arginine-rich splicing factor 8 [Babesia microti strain RI]|uniref:Serine/arginine-rich splicing factor 8 n=1 Tax=Babesia microti (strain RI) TaxID=1133968 RepID=A0A1R4AB89_BABMR|nr:Serine/arginine-rich splicing factor 8 [Babesia microti strain RI]SJK86266.1 Serine/arginine-rich splicing factor 8 [Babesia microti strain RI]|eukprot:XP_021338446.1 Serine/arginine-rich splicing factor 8 [Babesia microti strain RI]